MTYSMQERRDVCDILRGLAAYQHSDVSVADDAVRIIEDLEAQVTRMRIIMQHTLSLVVADVRATTLPALVSLAASADTMQHTLEELSLMER